MKDELNWRNVWEKMQKQRMRPLKITFDPKFKENFAQATKERDDENKKSLPYLIIF